MARRLDQQGRRTATPKSEPRCGKGEYPRHPPDRQSVLGPGPWRRFEQVRSLGQGATAQVFEVIDHKYGARCALKQLRMDRPLSPRQVAGFKDEFRELSQLSHPNLAKVYELIEEHGQLYVLMELIDGVDFVRYVRGGEARSLTETTAPESEFDTVEPVGGILSMDRLRPALSQLATGVLVLHDADRIHCDLKPDNVLVEPSGRVVIVDFGLVSLLAAGASPRVGGTPHYMAPEQLSGWPCESSDWYAFAVILYLALTGRLPYCGSTKAILYEKRVARPMDPRRLISDLPDDLAELCVRLLVPDPQRRPSTEVIRRALGVHLCTELQRASEPFPLVGRDPHLQALHRAFDEVHRDHGLRCVTIRGESGIGKTALVNRFLEDIRLESPVPRILRSACHQDVSVPCKGLDPLLDRIASEPSGAPLLDGVDMVALSTMFPIFRHKTAPFDTPVVARPAELRRRAVTALKDLFTRLCRSSRTVIFVDDMQWADTETIELLREIIATPNMGPLLLILGHRGPAPETTPQPPPAFHAHLDLVLGPLARTAVHAYIKSVLAQAPPASELDRIAEECSGNPLLLRQLLLAAPSAGTPKLSLEQALELRLTGLEAVPRAYAEIVCVAARPVGEELVAALLKTSGAEALQARHTLAAACLIRRSDDKPGAIEPYHDLIREHVVRTIPDRRLKTYHGQLAERLSQRPDADAEVLAIHFREAGRPEKARRYVEQAAAAAAKALSFHRAALLYADAVAMAPADARPDIELKRADALSNAGRPLEAAQVFLRVLAERPEDLDIRLRAGDELLRAGQNAQGLEVIRAGAYAVGELVPRSDLFTLLSLLWHGVRLRQVRVPPQAFGRTPDAKQRQRLGVCLVAARRLAIIDTPAAALLLRRYLTRALTHGSHVDIARGLALEAAFCAHMSGMVAGGPERAQRLVAQARELVGANGAADVRAFAGFAEAMVAYWQGHFRACRLSLTRALDIQRTEVVFGGHWEVSMCQSFIGIMLWWEGDLHTMRANMDEYHAEAAGHLSLETKTTLRVAAMLALANDEPDKARVMAEQTIQRWPKGPFRTHHYLHEFAQTEIELYERNAAAAQRRLVGYWRASVLAGIFQQRSFALQSLVQRARVALASGQIRRANQAIAPLESASEQWVRVLAEVLRGLLDGIQGRRAAAIDRLRAGAAATEHWEMGLYSPATRYRLHRLEGQPQLAEEALKQLQARGVVHPRRLIGMLLPVPAGSWPLE